jgi:hypothetical protein
VDGIAAVERGALPPDVPAQEAGQEIGGGAGVGDGDVDMFEAGFHGSVLSIAIWGKA